MKTVAVAVVGLMAGCEVEETRKGYRPMLGGLPGAEGGYAISPVEGAEGEASRLGDDELEIKQPDGSKVLLA